MNDLRNIAIRIIIFLTAIYAYNHIIPIHLRDIVLGGTILLIGIYYIIIPFKEIKGINRKFLPKYSKKLGIIALLIAGSCTLLGVDANTGLLGESSIAYFLLLFIALSSYISMFVVYFIYKKKSKNIVIGQLEFTSLEEFLDSHRTVRAGKATGELACLAEKVNFAALEKLFFPTGIPAEFQIYKIITNKENASIWYLHKEDLTSEDKTRDAIVHQRHYLFSFTRLDIESPMDSILRQNFVSKEFLIEGKYLFVEPNQFIWASEREVLNIYAPLLLTSTRDNWRDAGMGRTLDELRRDGVTNMVSLCKTLTVDLLDEAEKNCMMRQDTGR